MNAQEIGTMLRNTFEEFSNSPLKPTGRTSPHLMSVNFANAIEHKEIDPATLQGVGLDEINKWINEDGDYEVQLVLVPDKGEYAGPYDFYVDRVGWQPPKRKRKQLDADGEV